MDRMRSVIALRDMLRDMEADLGLDHLTRVERDVFLAARDLTQAPGTVVQSDQIRQHRLVRNVAQATYQRALRKLLALEFLSHPKGAKAKHYTVNKEFFGG